MKQDNYTKLEKNTDFKRKYLNKTTWWKNILMLPPMCFLFIGLTGMIYLFKQDMLVSLYIIPYIILFMIGTIWLKAIKKHIQKAKMAVKESFHVCLASPITEEDGKVYALFTNDTHRHNKHYINNIVNTVSANELLGKYKEVALKKSLLIYDQEVNTNFYLRAYSSKGIDKAYKNWQEEKSFPVLFIDETNTFVVKEKDLTI